MRKLTTLFILLALSLPMWAGIHTYTETSVLKEGKWVKIRVSESGVCRMSFSQLRDAGLEPTQLRVYGFGGALLAHIVCAGLCRRRLCAVLGAGSYLVALHR